MCLHAIYNISIPNTYWKIKCLYAFKLVYCRPDENITIMFVTTTSNNNNNNSNNCSLFSLSLSVCVNIRNNNNKYIYPDGVIKLHSGGNYSGVGLPHGRPSHTQSLLLTSLSRHTPSYLVLTPCSLLFCSVPFLQLKVHILHFRLLPPSQWTIFSSLMTHRSFKEYLISYIRDILVTLESLFSPLHSAFSSS